MMCYSFFHSIGMFSMWWFLAILRSFFYSPVLYTSSCHSSPTILPSSLTSSCLLLMYEIITCEMDLKVMHFSYFYVLEVPFRIRICAHLNEHLYRLYNLCYVIVKLLLNRTSDRPVDFVWPPWCWSTNVIASFKEILSGQGRTSK
jgi:hypothetical protein